MHIQRYPAPPWEGYTLRSSFFVVGFLIYLMIFLFVSLTVDNDAMTVLLATFPIALSLAMHSVVASVHPRRRMLLISTFVVPFLSSMFFAVLYSSRISPIVNQMDAGSVVVWQIIASLFLLLLSWLFVRHSTKIRNLHRAQPYEQQVAQRSTNPTPALTEKTTVTDTTRIRGPTAVPGAPYYNQMVQQYAAAAQAHAARANQLESELATAQTALSTASLSSSREDEYRKQIAELEQKLAKERAESEDFERRNADYEAHIKSLETTVSRLKGKLEVSEKNFTARLRGIEDKAKAINFVIGRVYSDRNGGNATIRETLNIDRSLYNAFSEMSSDGAVSDENRKKLIMVLEQIYGKLVNLELAENKLFKLSSRAKLIRDAAGNNTILEVLAKNDSDPVLDYFVEAKEICTNMLNYLRR